MMKSKATFFVVFAVTLSLAFLAFFGLKIPALNIDLKGANEMRFGIDIRGGVDAAFVPKDLDRAPTETELEAARSVIEVRLDQRSILDRDVTIDKENGYVFVRFPWQTGETDFDPNKAITELGSMAHLTFQELDGNIVLEGSHVESTTWSMDQTGATFLVHLKLKPEGRERFAEATGRLQNQGEPILILMDDVLISAPTVNERIDSNECVITNIATAEEARTLSNQINSGALPFSLHTENYSAISPTLGSNALNVMVTAGFIAFAIICFALICYSRMSGVVASIALVLQVSGQLIMLTWPQLTVTLPGIAGIILAIGMGVDANIIISERIREELRSGKSVGGAVTSGFKRAFSSVFDGNITVLIVAFVMMVFGSGAILSFAYTLLFGIIMNFVAGVLATRLMISSIIQFPSMRKSGLFLSDKSLAKKEVKAYPFFSKRKIYYAISGCVAVAGIIMMFVNGVHLDIQFKGGTIVKYSMTNEINTDDAANIAGETLSDQIISAQIVTDYATQEKKLVLNMSGKDTPSNDELESITAALQNAYPDQSFELLETNNVAPFFGKQFLRNGVISIVLSAVLIIAYVWFSFRKIHGLSAGAMALLALLHDLLVVFFAFVIFRIPIGDSFIAVALTILGYSINDTIVIYDRIRENTRMGGFPSYEALVDTSISQSFTRSLNTNLAVLISVFLIFIFASANGLESIRAFALPMTVGTISGCYSTICIAGPAWTMWQNHKRKNPTLQEQPTE